MQLDIYALDAGNFDGEAGTYQTLDSEKMKRKYPGGYKNIGTFSFIGELILQPVFFVLMIMQSSLVKKTEATKKVVDGIVGIRFRLL